MSNTKTVMGQASNQYVTPLDITDVFSTYLYTGNGSTQTITNGIDLDGEGGLVWIKSRTGFVDHNLMDTERGLVSEGGGPLTTTSTAAQGNNDQTITSFNSNGFTVGTEGSVSTNGMDFASWTFRKAPKFFDVVTYTGDGTGNRIISHGLNSTPGMLVVRPYDAVSDWFVNHRGNGTAGLKLNTTDATAFSPVLSLDGNLQWDSTTVTLKTNFNNSGVSYVAYVFAHNDGDGGFGPDGDQDIIKCGSYSQSSASDVDVDLGFEPQFVIVKRSDDTSQWYILDEMRGFLAGSNSTSSRTLYASLANAEADFTIQKTATGFTWPSGQYGSGTQEYIYMAIRRGPLAQPESATEVFDVQFNGGNDPSKAPVYQSGFVTDMSIVGLRTGGSVNYPYTGNRLMGIQTLETHNTDAEESGGASFQWDFMNGFIDGVPSVITDTQIAWMWKRAPGFFDVVAYTGENGMGGQTDAKPHNLGVVPEMIWIKTRSLTGREWVVWVNGFGTGQTDGTGTKEWLYLNTSASLQSSTSVSNVPWGGPHTATTFSTGSWSRVNDTGATYIAYLFATVPGVSKVGSYTGDGTTDGSKVIDCGFTSGARFVLIKSSNPGGDWMVYDTTRGIVVGNDPILSLNDTAAEATTYDNLIPNSSGFAVIQNTDGAYTTNESGYSYIFYAIA